jgi:hypothetical protein
MNLATDLSTFVISCWALIGSTVYGWTARLNPAIPLPAPCGLDNFLLLTPEVFTEERGGWIVMRIYQTPALELSWIVKTRKSRFRNDWCTTLSGESCEHLH